MSNWQNITPMNQGAPGAPVRAGGGGGIQTLNFRSALDARRSMMGDRVPQAQYPDGYLGGIQSRREDRLLKNLQERNQQRPYQRGVHKGERIAPQDYFWPEEFTPETGLEYEARGLKWTARGTVQERLAHLGHTEFASDAERRAILNMYGITDGSPVMSDPIRQQRLARLLPGWR